MRRAGKFRINKKNYIWVKFLAGVILLVVMVCVLSFFTPPIKNYFLSISSPIQKFFWTTGDSSSFFLSSLLNSGSLAGEVQKLKAENHKLQSQISFLQSLQRGTQEFDQAETICQSQGFDVVMAGVIGLGESDILSINKGLADGISEGMPVVNQQNVLFGRVVKTYKNFSEVMLLSNKDSVTSVKVQQHEETEEIEEAEEVEGVVRGKGDFSAYLDLVPITSEINHGDVLITSAVEKYFPKNLLVGTIIKGQKNDQKPFQHAEVNLFSDISGLENLFVIINYKQIN